MNKHIKTFIYVLIVIAVLIILFLMIMAIAFGNARPSITSVHIN